MISDLLVCLTVQSKHLLLAPAYVLNSTQHAQLVGRDAEGSMCSEDTANTLLLPSWHNMALLFHAKATLIHVDTC